MSGYRVGCYVLHKKLPDLGSGEVVMVDKGAIRIRFASGERNFAELQVDPHLEITAEAPAAPATQAGKKRAARAPRKTAAKRTGVKSSTPPKADTAAQATAADDADVDVD